VNISVVGTLSIDLVAEVDRLPRPGESVASRGLAHKPGGPGMLQSIAASRLEANASVYGCVGPDSFGDMIIATLGRAGIDTGGVERASDTPTGASLVLMEATLPPMLRGPMRSSTATSSSATSRGFAERTRCSSILPFQPLPCELCSPRYRLHARLSPAGRGALTPVSRGNGSTS